MTDYLAAARDHAAAVDGATFGSSTYLAHMTAITALASLAIAEALPQGTDDVAPATIRHDVAPGPSPAEPVSMSCPACGGTGDVWSAPDSDGKSGPIRCGLCCGVGRIVPDELPLVALDRAEAEAITALIEWRKVDRIYPPEAPEAWPALLRLRDVADRLGLAR